MKTAADRSTKDHIAVAMANTRKRQASGVSIGQPASFQLLADKSVQVGQAHSYQLMANQSVQVKQASAFQVLADNRIQEGPSRKLQPEGSSQPVVQRVTLGQEEAFKVLKEKVDKRQGSAEELLSEINEMTGVLEKDRTARGKILLGKLAGMKVALSGKQPLSPDTLGKPTVISGSGAKKPVSRPAPLSSKNVRIFSRPQQPGITKAAAGTVPPVQSGSIGTQLAELGFTRIPTVGDGNCSIHALLGQENQDGELECVNAQEVRGLLADEYEQGQLVGGAMEKMAYAHENTIGTYSTKLLQDYQQGAITDVAQGDVKERQGAITAVSPAVAQGDVKGKGKEGKDVKAAQQGLSLAQLENNLREAIRVVNIGHFEEGIVRKVQASTFDQIMDGRSGAEILAALKVSTVINADDTVKDIDARLFPSELEDKTGNIQALLRPYITGKTDNRMFVQRAMADPGVQAAYMALLRHQHYWLSAEELQALAIQRGKSVQLFENVLGRIQETAPVNEGEQRTPIPIYSSGTHFERLGPRVSGSSSGEVRTTEVPSDKLQPHLYTAAQQRYHTPFKRSMHQAPTSEKLRARHVHGLGHGIRVAASVLSLLHKISEQHAIKFAQDDLHIKALSMAALWHDAANEAEDDKMDEAKHAQLFTQQLDPLCELISPAEREAYLWARDCLQLKGKVAGIKPRQRTWEDLSAEEQGAAIIAGADSYEYVRTYDPMKKKYAPSRNVLVNVGALDAKQDGAHADAVIDLILHTGGNTVGAKIPGGATRPEQLATYFEFHGIRAVREKEGAIGKAFEVFLQTVPPEKAAEIMGIFSGWGTGESGSRIRVSPVKKPVAGGGQPRSSSVETKVKVISAPTIKPRSSGGVLGATSGRRKPGVPVKESAGSQKKRVINFFPRDAEGKRTPGTQAKDGMYNQGRAPDFREDRSGKTIPVDVEQTLALVHGISTQHVGSTFKRGYLSSAYMREGPFGKYSRTADKLGGGGLAVYTRAVGKGHRKWPATGTGVGSSGSKTQIVLSPSLLVTKELVWRHSSTDLKGNLPGGEGLRAHKDKDSFDYWEQQSEGMRNRAFNDTVGASSLTGLENNEQTFWAQIPLAGNVLAIVCSSVADQQAIIAAIGSGPERGTVSYEGHIIRVIVAGDQQSLLEVLTVREEAVIANEGEADDQSSGE
ncbi:hypothetical protein KTO58_16155 [Chitinophaga pendula]|uniref:hypothetical protein n=1 Tax=Chitinophaga TaxID=79328 RepID=UPI000BAF8989|nr:MULTISPECIES: hypothetical protein [Chitinophaga]ASZ11755.1 hypothetical protein CK934_12695 [Chitinophaga sp. MD30]UCJ05226.1 hypothetical protein KTO58_16155 [Chitinophaga pendula]